MATITTPVKGFTGVVVGVTFSDGVGETSEVAALEYFARQGYTIEHDEAEDTEAEAKDTEAEAKDTEGSGDVLPAGNASTEVWLAYALAHGTTPDELEGKGRDEIRELITNAKTPE